MRTWLKEYREAAEMTQEQIALKVEISRPYFTEIEKALKNPSVSVAKKIAKELGFEWTIFFENL